MSGEAMTTDEVARALGVSRRYVQMLIKDGKLPAKNFGRALVIDRDALRRYQERQERQKGEES